MRVVCFIDFKKINISRDERFIFCVLIVIYVGWYF